MYGLLDAFKGGFSQQAEHYERRMRQLHTNLHGQLAAVSLPETYQHSGTLRLDRLLMIRHSLASALCILAAVAASCKESLCCTVFWVIAE